MTIYQVWILALYVAGMVCFALATFTGYGRGVSLGLLCWITVGFSATVNSIT
jgi:hypothetical protein